MQFLCRQEYCFKDFLFQQRQTARRRLFSVTVQLVPKVLYPSWCYTLLSNVRIVSKLQWSWWSHPAFFFLFFFCFHCFFLLFFKNGFTSLNDDGVVTLHYLDLKPATHINLPRPGLGRKARGSRGIPYCHISRYWPHSTLLISID